MIFTKGVLYMFAAVFFFSCMGLVVKLTDHIPAIELVFFRSLVSLIMSVAMLKVQKVSVWGKNKKLLIFRGLSGALALVLYFIILQSIPLASAVMLGFIAPIFTTLLGVFIVKEKVFKLQWVFFLLAFVGIYLVEGFDPRVKWIYILFGLVASFSSGLAYNFIRKLKTSEHPLVIIFYFPLVTLPLTGIYCLFFEWVTPVGWDWAYLLAIGILTQTAQYLMTRSLQIEALSKVSIIRYTSIVFALSFGYIFFEETYDWLAYIGMVLSISGVALNLWYRQYRLNKISKTSLAPSAS